MSKESEKAAAVHAAERRADYVRALTEERDMCDRGGKVDRVKAITAELKRVDKVSGRKAPAADEAADVDG